jgi:tetratricopeptide (TPR) repeat protein
METYEKMINVAKRLGLNLPMAERLFSIAESYFENGEFESVIEYTEKGLKNINEMATRKGLSEQLNAEIKGRALDAEVPVVEGEKEQKEPKLEPISSTPTTKTKTISKAKADKPKKKKGEPERVKPGAKKKTLKDKKSKKSKTALKLKGALGKIRDEIKEAKSMGFEVDEAATLIKKAFSDLKENNFVSAKETGIEAKNTIKNIKKGFIKQKALDLVKVAWKEISDAEVDGKDVTEANGLLEEARNLIKEGKYEMAAEAAIKAVNIFK